VMHITSGFPPYKCSRFDAIHAVSVAIRYRSSNRSFSTIMYDELVVVVSELAMVFFASSWKAAPKVVK